MEFVSFLTNLSETLNQIQWDFKKCACEVCLTSAVQKQSPGYFAFETVLISFDLVLSCVPNKNLIVQGLNRRNVNLARVCAITFSDFSVHLSFL